MARLAIIVSFLTLTFTTIASAQVPANDAAMYLINMNEFAEYSEITVTGVFKNLGSDTLKNVMINWKVDEGVIHRFAKQNISVKKNQTWPFTSPDKLIINKEGAHVLKIWVSSPNGQLDENAENDTLTHTIQAVQQYPVKQVMLEEITGAWCGYCPRAPIIVQKRVLPYFPQVISVAIHTGDAMAISEASSFISTYVTGVPTGFLDRNKAKLDAGITYAPEQWQNTLGKLDLKFTPLDIQVYNYYSPDGREWKVDVIADFVFDMNGNYRMNCYIIEDSLIGSGSAWEQRNFFNLSAENPYMELKGAGDPIPDYYHMHVVRKMTGGSWGEAGIIPQNPKRGERYVYSTTFTVPDGWEIENLHVIGIVQLWDQDPLKRSIVNVKETELSLKTGTMPIEEVNGISLFPNPAKEAISIKVNSKSGGKITIDILNSLGQPVRSTTRDLSSGQDVIQIPTPELQKGMYWVLVTTGNQRKTLRFVKD